MNSDGQVYFDDEENIPEEDKRRYENAFIGAGLATTGRQLLAQEWTDEDRVNMQKNLERLSAAIEEIERKHEQEKQLREQASSSGSEEDAQDDD